MDSSIKTLIPHDKNAFFGVQFIKKTEYFLKP